MKYEDFKNFAINNTKSYQQKSKPSKISPARIMINGEFIVTNSGKTVWKRIGDAKSALRNHLEQTYHMVCRRGSWDYKEKDRLVNQFIGDGLVEGWLEYVSWSEDKKW